MGNKISRDGPHAGDSWAPIGYARHGLIEKAGFSSTDLRSCHGELDSQQQSVLLDLLFASSNGNKMPVL
ncbi:hypothetical protein NC653_032950 [Populus alba x Populus x berolinensis]|uniref:Uncharacterized protein n=1 Tax=Populus alba x Populus x berolinensis TaxID=444605 RepID=A0AAD6LSU4_9ROSI|nr:hypothetical protein NC653_032950 [Populus alba x Populus x berolinensis]